MRPPADRARLIVDGAVRGAWNMAVDEAILEDYVHGDPARPPTLRLYSWTPAALSLGRGQPATGAHDPRWLKANGIDLVRRPTGGLAVLHEHERTYAVIGRLDRVPFRGGVVETYAGIASALLDALARLGVPRRTSADPRGKGVDPRRSETPVCFEIPGAHEPLSRELKLVGSAQLRRRSAFLQHGSIPLRLDPRRLGRATGRDAAPGGFIDLERAVGRRVAVAEVDSALVEAFRICLGSALEQGELTAAERAGARQLHDRVYASREWTYAR